MEKPKTQQLYPEATKGWMKTGSSPTPKPPKKPLFKVRDREPSTIIGMVIGTAFIIGLIGLAAYYVAHQRSEQASSQQIATRVAQKIAKMNSAQTYDAMQANIDNEFKNCRDLPEIILTHHYQEPGKPAVYTTIDLNEKDLSSILEKVVDRADSAVRNELTVYCRS